MASRGMADLTALPRLIQAQDWAAAESLLRGAAMPSDAPAEVFYNLAKIVEMQGKWTDAGPWLHRATQRRANYAMAWFELGRWAADHDDRALALTAFRHAAALDPTDRDARRNLGRIALRQGDWDTVLTAFDGQTDLEARIALYRARTETGADTRAELDALLARKDARAAVFKAMTRTAKGRVPLRLPR